MNATHTPGPWGIHKQTHREGYKFVVTADDFWPAAIFSDGCRNEGTAEANARLIAAAPTLLDAAKAVLASDALIGNSASALAAFSQLRGAVKKAEGGFYAG